MPTALTFRGEKVFPRTSLEVPRPSGNVPIKMPRRPRQVPKNQRTEKLDPSFSTRSKYVTRDPVTGLRVKSTPPKKPPSKSHAPKIPRCAAITHDGKRCKRDGAVQIAGQWFCRQHAALVRVSEPVEPKSGRKRTRPVESVPPLNRTRKAPPPRLSAKERARLDKKLADAAARQRRSIASLKGWQTRRRNALTRARQQEFDKRTARQRRESRQKKIPRSLTVGRYADQVHFDLRTWSREFLLGVLVLMKRAGVKKIRVMREVPPGFTSDGWTASVGVMSTTWLPFSSWSEDQMAREVNKMTRPGYVYATELIIKMEDANRLPRATREQIKKAPVLTYEQLRAARSRRRKQREENDDDDE